MYRMTSWSWLKSLPVCWNYFCCSNLYWVIFRDSAFMSCFRCCMLIYNLITMYLIHHILCYLIHMSLMIYSIKLIEWAYVFQLHIEFLNLIKSVWRFHKPICLLLWQLQWPWYLYLSIFIFGALDVFFFLLVLYSLWKMWLTERFSFILPSVFSCFSFPFVKRLVFKFLRVYIL